MRLILRSTQYQLYAWYADRFHLLKCWNRWIQIWQQPISRVWNGIWGLTLKRQSLWWLAGLRPMFPVMVIALLVVLSFSRLMSLCILGVTPVRVNFNVWGTEGKSVPCVCSIRSSYRRPPYAWVSDSFFAARNTRTSAALGELVLMIPRCRTDQFSLSFMPAASRLWNLLVSVFSGRTLSSFNSDMNMCIQNA